MTPYSLSLTILRIFAVLRILATVGAYVEGFFTYSPDLDRSTYVSDNIVAFIIAIGLYTIILAVAKPIAKLIAASLPDSELKWHPNVFRTGLRLVGFWLIVSEAGALGLAVKNNLLGDQSLFPALMSQDSVYSLVLGIILVFTSGMIANAFQRGDNKALALDQLDNREES